MYPICQTSDKSGLPNLQTNGICQTSDKLTWSHICELVTIDDQLEREFYEKECISEGWTVNELHRQKESGLFMRLAVSKDKQGVLTLAHEGQQVQTPEDVVKNTYTLEFLGTWEMIHNPNFKVVEFDHFKMQAGLPSFTLSASEWIEKQMQ